MILYTAYDTTTAIGNYYGVMDCSNTLFIKILSDVIAFHGKQNIYR